MSSQANPPPPDGNIAGDLEGVRTGLDDLDAVPVTEHVARFHALHESLTAALGSIDEV